MFLCHRHQNWGKSQEGSSSPRLLNALIPRAARVLVAVAASHVGSTLSGSLATTLRRLSAPRIALCDLFSSLFVNKVGDHTSVLAAEGAVPGGGFKDSQGGTVVSVDHVSAAVTGEVSLLA